jgi:hypothetical protein
MKVSRTWYQRLKRLVRNCLLVSIFGAGLGFLWWRFRPHPKVEQKSLFTGVNYECQVQNSPVPLVIHALKVDVKQASLRYLVTPTVPTGGHQLQAMTVMEFAKKYPVDIAINGDFFDPWWSKGPWDYYPHSGDGVDVMGYAVSERVVYGKRKSPGATMFISCSHHPSFRKPDEICYALSGQWLIKAGRIITKSKGNDIRHPRTGICMDKEESTMWLMVADGRQPHYSEGMTRPEMVAWMEQRNCYHALNLDGGGSSALVARQNGKLETLSSPIHTRIPGRQRPVANHFGLRFVSP